MKLDFFSKDKKKRKVDNNMKFELGIGHKECVIVSFRLFRELNCLMFINSFHIKKLFYRQS